MRLVSLHPTIVLDRRADQALRRRVAIQAFVRTKPDASHYGERFAKPRFSQCEGPDPRRSLKPIPTPEWPWMQRAWQDRLGGPGRRITKRQRSHQSIGEQVATSLPP